MSVAPAGWACPWLPSYRTGLLGCEVFNELSTIVACRFNARRCECPRRLVPRNLCITTMIERIFGKFVIHPTVASVSPKKKIKKSTHWGNFCCVFFLRNPCGFSLYLPATYGCATAVNSIENTCRYLLRILFLSQNTCIVNLNSSFPKNKSFWKTCERYRCLKRWLSFREVFCESFKHFQARCFSCGDCVRVTDDLQKMKILQLGHGGFVDSMRRVSIGLNRYEMVILYVAG